MLGLTPAPQGATTAPNVHGAPVTGALLAGLGMLAFGLLAMMPTTFDGVSLVRTLMALSLAIGGMFGILIGYASVSTRIEIAPEGVLVTTPGWRARKTSEARLSAETIASAVMSPARPRSSSRAV